MLLVLMQMVFGAGLYSRLRLLAALKASAGYQATSSQLLVPRK
jgi:hypothetical protein